MTTSIKPGHGSSEIHLGMSREQVESALGMPGRIGKADDLTKLSYPERGFLHRVASRVDRFDSG